MKAVWTTRELLAQGARPDDVARRVRGGELVRLRRGAYGAGIALTPEQAHRRLIDAALATLGPDAVASHASAAVLHGLPVERSLLDRAWVTRSAGSHGRTTGTLHQFRAGLAVGEITRVDGVPCTTPLRTAADLALVAGYDWAVAAWDALLHLDLASPAEVQSAAAALGRRHGASVARAAAAFADGRAASALESLSRVRMAQLALPTPSLQHRIYLDGVLVAVSDFAWPEFGLVGEADGMVKYRDQGFDHRSSAEVLRDEKRRQDRIREAGWWVCRWEWATVHQPQAFERRIRAGLQHGAEVARSRRGNNLGEPDEPRSCAS